MRPAPLPTTSWPRPSCALSFFGYIPFGCAGSITCWFALCMRLGVSSVFLALNDQVNIRLTEAPLIGSCYTAISFALT